MKNDAIRIFVESDAISLRAWGDPDATDGRWGPAAAFPWNFYRAGSAASFAEAAREAGCPSPRKDIEAIYHHLSNLAGAQALSNDRYVYNPKTDKMMMG